MKPFSDETRQLLGNALEHARRFGGALVGAEHLLLALATHHEEFRATLGQHQITPDMLRDAIGEYFSKPRRVINAFSPRTRRVLTSAQHEAQQDGSEHIESWHLLVALLEETDGPARDVLSRLGFHSQLQREEVARVRSNERAIRAFQSQLEAFR